MLLDGVIGREQSAIGTVPNKRKPGWSSVEQANSAAHPSPAEHAMIEAAIQLDLITPEQAEALVGQDARRVASGAEEGRSGRG